MTSPEAHSSGQHAALHAQNITTPTIAILLCTYNGQQFLAQQLDSLEKQTYPHWYLIVSDDGSSDQTLAILQQYQAKWGQDPFGQNRLSIRGGPQQGFCQNFLSLACDPQIKANYYSFCDQDDVWLPSKLRVAIDYLQAQENQHLALAYCGRTAYVDQNLKPCGQSPLFSFPRSFRNALVQSIAGGNTFVLNQSAKNLLEMAGPLKVPSHDWWFYLLITGSGGYVYYDPIPQLLYRQHKDALVGGNATVKANVKRLTMLLGNRFKDWTTQNLAALKQCETLLLTNSRDNLMLFESMRTAPLKDRFRLIEVCGLYRQTWRGTVSLILAAFLRKL